MLKVIHMKATAEKKENRPPAEGNMSRIGEKGSASLLSKRAMDILQRMGALSSNKLDVKDPEAVKSLKREIDEVLSDSDAPSLMARQEKTVWVSIYPKGDPCELGGIYSLHEALLDCRSYLEGCRTN